MGRQQRDVQADPDRTGFREAIERAEPNPGHQALAELERLGVLKMTITQNVDDLHRRVGQRLLAEIHGTGPGPGASCASLGGPGTTSTGTNTRSTVLSAEAWSRATR